MIVAAIASGVPATSTVIASDGGSRAANGLPAWSGKTSERMAVAAEPRPIGEENADTA